MAIKPHSFPAQNFHFTLKWPWSQFRVSGGCLVLYYANYLWCNYLWEWCVRCLCARPAGPLRAQPVLDLWVSRGWGACFWSLWMRNIKYTWKSQGLPVFYTSRRWGVWEVGCVRERVSERERERKEGGIRRGGVTSVSFQVGFYGSTSNNRSLALFLSPSPPWSLYRANWTVIGLSFLSWACVCLYSPRHHCPLKLHATNVSIRQVPDRLVRRVRLTCTLYVWSDVIFVWFYW